MASSSPSRQPTTALIGVQLLDSLRVVHLDPNNLLLDMGDVCLVEQEQGPTLGKVMARPIPLSEPKSLGISRVLRRASPRDMEMFHQSEEIEKQGGEILKKEISHRNMEMKMVSAKVALHPRKITFFFTSPQRVDFRDLVRVLAAELKMRIEMRQIGARDEAKVVGAIGPCGRQTCCSSWMTHFDPVTVKMAKNQDLSLVDSKLAGRCGRLKCCLRHEDEVYTQHRKELPRNGDFVKTSGGCSGCTCGVQVLKKVVTIETSDGSRVDEQAENITEIIPRSGRGSRDRSPAPEREAPSSPPEDELKTDDLPGDDILPN